MPLKRRTPVPIADVVLLEPSAHGDDRGRFVETYRREWLPLGREMIQGEPLREGRRRGRRAALPPPPGRLLVRAARHRPRGAARPARRLADATKTTFVVDLDGDEERGLFIPPGRRPRLRVAHRRAAVVPRRRLLQPRRRARASPGTTRPSARTGELRDPVLSARDQANPLRDEIPDALRPHAGSAHLAATRPGRVECGACSSASSLVLARRGRRSSAPRGDPPPAPRRDPLGPPLPRAARHPARRAARPRRLGPRRRRGARARGRTRDPDRPRLDPDAARLDAVGPDRPATGAPRRHDRTWALDRMQPRARIDTGTVRDRRDRRRVLVAIALAGYVIQRGRGTTTTTTPADAAPPAGASPASIDLTLHDGSRPGAGPRHVRARACGELIELSELIGADRAYGADRLIGAGQSGSKRAVKCRSWGGASTIR